LLENCPCLAVQIPAVSLNDDGKIVVVSEENGRKLEEDSVNKEKRKLTLRSIPFSLTCILHKNYILADPTAEEESIMETLVTVVLDSASQLVSLYKPGGPVLAYTSAVQVSFHTKTYLKDPSTCQCIEQF
jgi:exosome complex component RRP43